MGVIGENHTQSQCPTSPLLSPFHHVYYTSRIHFCPCTMRLLIPRHAVHVAASMAVDTDHIQLHVSVAPSYVSSNSTTLDDGTTGRRMRFVTYTITSSSSKTVFARILCSV